MTKNKYRLCVVLADVLLISVYSAILFLLAKDYDKVFFCSYGFTVFSMIILGGAVYSLLIQPMSMKEAFLHEPYCAIGLSYFAVQFLYGLWELYFSEVRFALLLSGNILFLGGYLMALIWLVMAVNRNKDLEQEIDDSRFFIKEFNKKMLHLGVNVVFAQDKFMALVEDMRYILPTSNDNTFEVEADIFKIVRELEANIDNEEKFIKGLDELKQMLDLRNTLGKF